MATPLGHALVGVVSYSAARSRKHWRLIEVLACAFLATLPDLDILYSAFVSGKVGTYHRQFTHQPAFALLIFFVALGIGFWIRREPTKEVVFRGAFAGFLVFTHYLMDFWVKLPYHNPLWTGESSLQELLVLEMQWSAVFNYLIDLLVYGVVYAVFVVSLGVFVRRTRRYIARNLRAIFFGVGVLLSLELKGGETTQGVDVPS